MFSVAQHLPQPSDEALGATVAEFERFAAEEDALALVAAGRALDTQRARLADRVLADRAVARAGRLTLAEKVAVALDSRLGYLIADDGLFAATVDDVVAVLVERA
jgi:hypothetical protein